MTQTPTSLYSQDSSGTLNVSRDSNETNVTTDEDIVGNMADVSKILYDIPGYNRQPVQKSNSRVASVGRLRLHVESFRQAKNTSGTQTEQVCKCTELRKSIGKSC